MPLRRAMQASPLPGGGLDRRFFTLWGASAASNLGDGIWLIAAPLLAATLTRDPTLVAGLAFAQRLPWLLFGLVGGALADRLDRRRTMVVVALLRASLVGVLGLAALFDWASMPLLYVVFFLIATGETLFDTSALALLPAVVPREQLPKANARLSGTWTVTNQFVGPPLGGLLYSVAAGLPFLLGAGGLCAAAGLLSTLRGSFRPERAEDSPRRTLRAEIGEGLHWLWGQRLLRTISLAMGLLNLTLVAQVAIMVLVAEERFGLGTGGYGLLITAYGIGGVAGSLIAERVLVRTGESGYLRLAIVFEAAAPAGLALATDAVLAGAILALFGLHAMVWGALLTSLRQELTPDRLRGRVGSVHALIEYGTAAPGALLGGLLAAHFGLTAPLWVGAVAGVLLLPVVWGAFSTASIAAARQGAGTSV
jgi:MFS family permease